MQSFSEIKTGKELFDKVEIGDLDKQSILVIEESSQIIEVIKSALGIDYQFIFVPKGKDAVEIAQLQIPDIILLDVTTAEMEGYKICSRLKATPSTSNIPVILLSGPEKEGDARGFMAGAADYITKPILPFVLRARVSHHIELKRYNDLLENLVPITKSIKMANRNQLINYATREWRRATRHQTPLSLIILEIDFFKDYTDYYGLTASDDCLRQIDNVLTQYMKREPDMAARYTDDEFACLLPETDANGAFKVANSIQEVIEELNIPFACSQEIDHITMSLGVATMRPAPKQELHSLFHQAELLLAEAKRAGHNQIRCWQGC